MERDTFSEQFKIGVERAPVFWRLVHEAQLVVDRHSQLLGIELSPPEYVSARIDNARYLRDSIPSLLNSLPSKDLMAFPTDFVSSWDLPPLKVSISRGMHLSAKGLGEVTLVVRVESPKRLVAKQNALTMESDFREIVARLESEDDRSVLASIPRSEAAAVAVADTTPATASDALPVLPKTTRLPGWTNNALVAALVSGLLLSGFTWAAGRMSSLDSSTSYKLLYSALFFLAAAVPFSISTWLILRTQPSQARGPWWRVAGGICITSFAALGVITYLYFFWRLWTQS